jgi:hypothetical protein
MAKKIGSSVAERPVGQTATDAIDPTFEDTYWRERFPSRPYAKPDAAYETFRPAYRLGWDARQGRYGELNWHDLEPRLRQTWEQDAEFTTLGWEEAREAARDAWSRLEDDHRHENR